MSGHNSSKPEFSHPVLWTAGLAFFAFFLAWLFSSNMDQGYGDGLQHPRPRQAPTGPAIPDHVALIQDVLIDNLADSVELGEGIYARECASCHGADGQLNSGGARKLGVELLQNDEYGAGANPASIFHTLTFGWNAGAMPKKDNLSPEDRYRVVAYVREQFYVGTGEYSDLSPEYMAEIQAAVPAPRAEGAADGPQLNPFFKPIAIPVYTVLAEVATATDQTISHADWYELIAESDLGAYHPLQNTIAVVGRTEIAAELKVAVEKQAVDVVAELLTRPNITALAPEFATLSAPQLAELVTTLAQVQEGAN